jgi:hypothetical protein
VQSYGELVDDILIYGPALDQNHLDLYHVSSLESCNILAANILVKHGARLTLQAEKARGDVVLELYQILDWRTLLKTALFEDGWTGRSYNYESATLSWNINWLFGGRFDFSYRPRLFDMNSRKVNNMNFWNTGQKSKEVNEILDKIDLEQGWPISVEFRV